MCFEVDFDINFFRYRPTSLSWGSTWKSVGLLVKDRKSAKGILSTPFQTWWVILGSMIGELIHIILHTVYNFPKLYYFNIIFEKVRVEKTNHAGIYIKVKWFLKVSF